MRNSRVNEELVSANYGTVPGALPSPVAVKSQPFSYASPALSLFTGSPSQLPQGFDCNLAYWQSMQKQQTNKELPRSLHSHMPMQFHGFTGQANKDAPGSQRSLMPVHSPGFIGQTNRDSPGRQHSHLPVQYPGLIGLTNKDPRGSQPSHMPVQHPRFIKPQPKQLLNLQSNMRPPRSNHSQLPQQHLRLTKDQLESLQWQKYMETRWSNNTRKKTQHPSFTEHLLKRTGAIAPASSESQPQPSFLHATPALNQNKSAAKYVQDVSEKPHPISASPGNNLPRACYKGKEKVTSSSANMQSCAAVMNEPLGGLTGNWDPMNISHSFVQPKEWYYPRLPSEIRQALEKCSPPGATIPDPYAETDEVMFNIPFSRNSGSINLSGSIGNSNSLSLASNMKDPPSRKGKEVVKVYKRRRKD